MGNDCIIGRACVRNGGFLRGECAVAAASTRGPGVVNLVSDPKRKRTRKKDWVDAKLEKKKSHKAKPSFTPIC